MITKWRSSWGFATPDDLSLPDIFVHDDMVPESAGARRVGLFIECDAVSGKPGGNMQAANVRIAEAPSPVIEPKPQSIASKPIAPKPIDHRPLPSKIAALLDESDNGGYPKRKTKRERQFGK